MLPHVSLITILSIITALTILIAYITRNNQHEQFQNTYTDEQIAKAKALIGRNITFTEFKFNMPEMDIVDFNTFKKQYYDL